MASPRPAERRLHAEPASLASRRSQGERDPGRTVKAGITLDDGDSAPRSARRDHQVEPLESHRGSPPSQRFTATSQTWQPRWGRSLTMLGPTAKIRVVHQRGYPYQVRM